jgi:hypothetical protein
MQVSARISNAEGNDRDIAHQRAEIATLCNTAFGNRKLMSHETQIEAAKAVAHQFIATFNAQDHEGLADTLNYPHVRLALGEFTTIESRADFVARSERGKARLAEEDWHHTTVASMEVIHAGDDKVHLAICNYRCHEDGTTYNTFDTLWIATCLNGHWGIQFRSSYLR